MFNLDKFIYELTTQEVITEHEIFIECWLTAIEYEADLLFGALECNEWRE